MIHKNSTGADRSLPTFLVGEGEMVALIRGKDWSETPRGLMEI